jgi:hypothetical protein
LCITFGLSKAKTYISMERKYIYIEEFSEFVYYYGAPIYREEFSELVYYYGKPAYIEDFSEFVPEKDEVDQV